MLYEQNYFRLYYEESTEPLGSGPWSSTQNMWEVQYYRIFDLNETVNHNIPGGDA